MAEEMVYMTHKTTEGVGGPVPLSAFESYWKPVKGWERTEVDFTTDDQGNTVPVRKTRAAAATKEK